MAQLLLSCFAVVFLAFLTSAEVQSDIIGYDVEAVDRDANATRADLAWDELDDSADDEEKPKAYDMDYGKSGKKSYRKKGHGDKYKTAYDMEDVEAVQDEKIQDIKRTLDRLEKNTSKKSNTSQDENDSSDTSLTPAERAIFRRIVRRRRVFYPSFPYRFFDASNEDQEDDNIVSGSTEGNLPMESMMNNMNEQSMMGPEQDSVVLRLPKRVLMKLIQKFGSSGTRTMRNRDRSNRMSGLRLVRLVPVVLPMSDEDSR